jgi:anthranilate phosphoribosyltransferase
LVQANAAADLLLSGRVERLDVGVALARTHIASGAAWELVERLRHFSA